MARPRADAKPPEFLGDVLRRSLVEPARFPWDGGRWTPSLIGPTWRTVQCVDAKHYGVDHDECEANQHWDLPRLSIGWDAFDWIGEYLQLYPGQWWLPTGEQARFLLWWYAHDENGKFLFRDGVLQRLKGWGKDPLGAVLISLEMLGPCRLERRVDGLWRAVDNPNAWVQTAATALEQTKNTMRVFPSLISARARLEYGIQIGKEVIHALGDTRLVEAVTSSPATLEGGRVTFVLLNETQHWQKENQGHEMADVIERNATKSPDGAARTLAITNAYDPSKDSVAQRTREAYEEAEAGGTRMTRLLYDSVEADPKAPLSAEEAPAVVESIRGNSTWLDTERIVESILDLRNPPSRSRRWWYNQVVSVEDAWVTAQEWDAVARQEHIPAEGATVTLGFDGSSSRDHTALVGCDVESNHLFLVASFEPPKDGTIDRGQVDLIVRQAFERFDVVGFYADVREFESYIDSWGQEFAGDPPKTGLIVEASPKNPVAWDMRSRERLFTFAAESLHAAIVEGGKRLVRGEPAGFSHDGVHRFRWYALNARQNANRWGISVRKEAANSPKKIDAVPAAVLAWMARTDYLALPEEKRLRKKRTGKVW